MAKHCHLSAILAPISGIIDLIFLTNSKNLSPQMFSGHHRCQVQTNILYQKIGTKTFLKNEGHNSNVTNSLYSGCHNVVLRGV